MSSVTNPDMANRDSKTEESAKPRRRKRSGVLRLLVLGLVWLAFFGAMFLAWCAYDLPGLDQLNVLNRRPSVLLLANDGTMIASYGDLYGANVKLPDLPPYLPRAILATEDRRFYSHFGVDPIGIARSVNTGMSGFIDPVGRMYSLVNDRGRIDGLFGARRPL